MLVRGTMYTRPELIEQMYLRMLSFRQELQDDDDRSDDENILLHLMSGFDVGKKNTHPRDAMTTLFEEMGWSYNGATGELLTLSEGVFYTHHDDFWFTMGPFMRAGSFVIFVTEDGELRRWRFENEQFYCDQLKQIIWDEGFPTEIK